MHEFAVARSLLQEIESVAARERAASVQRVHLRIGALAGIEVDLLENAFDLVRPKTVCAEADLSVVISPAEWNCSLCGRAIEQGAPLRCGDCDVPARMVSGDEIFLERLEMEVADV